MRWRRRSPEWLNPIGWDEKAQRAHDVGLVGRGGMILHYSTCWCRKPVDA